MKSLFTILSLCILSFHSLFAQLPQIRFENFSVEEGWPGYYCNTPVYDIRGYLWIPTARGLYRYDGYNFKRFLHLKDDSTSLSSNQIHHVFPDKDGSLWLGTFGHGLNYMDPVTGKCKIYRYSKTDLSSISSDRISSIFRDSKNRLWIGTQGSEYCLNLFTDKTKSFSRIKLEERSKQQEALSSPINGVAAILETRNGNLIFGTPNGIWVYDDKTGTFQHRRNQHLRTEIVCALKEDNEGNIWIATWGKGLEKLNLQTGKYENYVWFKDTLQPNRNIASDIEFKSDKELWVSPVDTTFGIFNIQTKKFLFYQPDSSNKYKNIKGTANYLSKDPYGNLWLHQAFINYAKIEVKHQPFAYFDIQAYHPDMFFQSVTDLVKLNSTVYISTQSAQGLYQYDLKHKTARLLSTPPAGKNDYVNFRRNIKRDRLGTVWMATNRLFKVDTVSDTLVPIPMDSSLSPDSFNDLCVDRQNNVWLVSVRGLHLYNPRKKEWKLFTPNPVKPDSLPYNLLRSVCEDSKGRIWIGFDNYKGFSIYDPGTGKFIYYDCGSSDIPVKSVHMILKDRFGRMWMCGLGGIAIWDENETGDRPVKTLSISDGLDFDRLTGMATDTSGTVWALSYYGLNRIDPLSFQIRNFNAASTVFPIKSFSSIYISDDNELFLGAIKGFFKVNPDALKGNSLAPSVVINSFKVFDQEIPVDFFNLKNPLRLNYDQNYFSFEFAALSFDNAAKNQYAYNLEGFDQQWVYSGNRHYAAYTNVPGGHYTFRVKAANVDGVWNETGLSVPIFIAIPWWQQWWFYTLLAGSLAAFVYALYRYRLNQLMKIQSMRSQIASDLHDEIGSTLTSISFYSEMIRMQLPQENQSLKNLLDKIGANARTIVGTMSDIVWVINPKNDIPGNLIKRMKGHTAEICGERNIRYQFESEEDHRHVKLNLQQRKNIYLIYKEAVHNAIKYAACNEMTVAFKHKDKAVHLTIQDNGKGFDKNAASDGNGLANMKRRAEEIGAKFTVDTACGKGTCIRVSMKIT